MTAVERLSIGGLASLGPAHVPSGIVKRPVADRVLLTLTGLAGDAQGDTRHHGGPDKALHHYPHEHYHWWRETLPTLGPAFDAGASFGENVSTNGLTEADVCLGDVFTLGEALVEVSQSRQPCWRLNARFRRTDVANIMQASGRTGWYYRVRRSGLIGVGDELRLEARPYPAWPLSRTTALLFTQRIDRCELRAFLSIPTIPASWCALAERRLTSGDIEDWTPRLIGASAGEVTT